MADKQYTLSSTLAMARITNTLTEHVDALFHIVENALQFSLTVAEAGVEMDTPVLVNTIKGLEAVLEMRAASPIKNLYLEQRVRVTGLDYKDRMSHLRKAGAKAGKLEELLQDKAKSEAVSGAATTESEERTRLAKERLMKSAEEQVGLRDE